MIIYYIFLGLLQLAIPVLLIIGIVWLVKKQSSSPKINYIIEGKPQNFVSTGNSSVEQTIRAKIAAEIRAQVTQYKTASQKKVVEDMAQTVEYFAKHSYSETLAKHADTTNEYAQIPMPSANTQPVATAAASPTYITEEKVYETPWKKLQVLDGAVILLYLGAFFVLASIGLYVGLGVGTTIKAVLVTLLTFVFYIAGMALYSKSKRLKPAGMAFVAIGMATLPMAGAAIYYFGFNKSYGSVIWLTTSLAAILLYGHAMYKLSSPLVSYMVVFSTLSVVLSGISSLGLTPYYFVQGMGFAGLLFVFIGRLFKGSDFGVKEAYEQSAMFLVPFSVALSVLFVTRVGWMQLSLSLLVGATYYAYAWLTSGVYRATYSSLAQVVGIASILTGLYGVSENTKVIAVGASILAMGYTMMWLFWARNRPLVEIYRKQVKALTLCLPLVAVVALIATSHLIWLAVALTALMSAIVYAHDRDALSGLGWVASVLALPSLIGFLTVNPEANLSTVGLWYIGIMALSVIVRVGSVGYMTNTDTVFQYVILFCSMTIGAFMQAGASNKAQIIVAIAQVGLFALQAMRETSRMSWLVLSSFVQLSWIYALFDDARLLTLYTAGILVFNLVIAQLKQTSVLHDWLVGFCSLALPLMYGQLVATPHWSIKTYWAVYTMLFILYFGLRYIKTILAVAVSSFVYLFALVTSIVLAYSVSPVFGIVVSAISMAIFLYVEKIEKFKLFGYIAPLLTLGILFHTERTVWQIFAALVIVVLSSALLAVWRKRGYEAFLATVVALVLPWYVGRVIYDWSVAYLCVAYLGMSTVFVIKRQLLKTVKDFVTFTPALRIGFVTSLVFGTLYANASSWQLLAGALFWGGLILTAISYVENSPITIIFAFLYGYLSILRYVTGLELTLNEVVIIFVALSQGTYWILRASKLQTVRAAYARGFQLTVAMIIPCIGIGLADRPIFPVALALFALMLMKEVWAKGQGHREGTLLVLHAAILWIIHTLGVRELQVYTQSTALVVGLFAYWRRKREDTPSVINQYLWTAVLIFSIPMVWQAITSSNSMYSYIVLMEHTLLIVISIAFKRATFAWWGIAVVVASVLYQLRKLRYAALAFLGAFIISLAVYFLLRYNKPVEKDSKPQ